MAVAMCGSGCVILTLLAVIQGCCGAATGSTLRGMPASPLAPASIPRTSTKLWAFASWWPLFGRLWFLGHIHLGSWLRHHFCHAVPHWCIVRSKEEDGSDVTSIASRDRTQSDTYVRRPSTGRLARAVSRLLALAGDHARGRRRTPDGSSSGCGIYRHSVGAPVARTHPARENHCSAIWALDRRWPDCRGLRCLTHG